MTDRPPARSVEPATTGRTAAPQPTSGPEPVTVSQPSTIPDPRQTSGGGGRQIPRALLILLGLAGGGVAIFTARELAC